MIGGTGMDLLIKSTAQREASNLGVLLDGQNFNFPNS